MKLNPFSDTFYFIFKIHKEKISSLTYPNLFRSILFICIHTQLLSDVVSSSCNDVTAVKQEKSGLPSKNGAKQKTAILKNAHSEHRHKRLLHFSRSKSEFCEKSEAAAMAAEDKVGKSASSESGSAFQTAPCSPFLPRVK